MKVEGTTKRVERSTLSLSSPVHRLSLRKVTISIKKSIQNFEKGKSLQERELSESMKEKQHVLSLSTNNKPKDQDENPGETMATKMVINMENTSRSCHGYNLRPRTRSLGGSDERALPVKKQQRQRQRKRSASTNLRVKGRKKNVNYQTRFNLYKKSATKRNLSFRLSAKTANRYFNSPCYYCGERLRPNGIDRVDNKNGYFLENIVPACWPCNKLKGSIDVANFIKQCIKVAQNCKSKGIEEIHY